MENGHAQSVMQRAALFLLLGIVAGGAVGLYQEASAGLPSTVTSSEIVYNNSNAPVGNCTSCRVIVGTDAGNLLSCTADAGIIRSRTIKNCGTAAIDLGTGSVISDGGYLFSVGETNTTVIPATNAGLEIIGTEVPYHGIAASGTQVMCIWECY